MKDTAPTCCGQSCRLVTGAAIYPHRPDLAKLNFYRCDKCSAYVGCHTGTTKAKGTPAGKQLRQTRIQAHAAFDPIWRSGKMKRGEAYRWLAGAVEFDGHIHIGHSDLDLCERIIAACNAYQNNEAPPR